MKRTIRLTENELKRMISESVKRVLNEGIYDYPDGIDHLILMAENDRECYDIFWNIVQMLKKKYDKGVELSVDLLTNSSIDSDAFCLIPSAISCVFSLTACEISSVLSFSLSAISLLTFLKR